jgi:hypothetical protein
MFTSGEYIGIAIASTAVNVAFWVGVIIGMRRANKRWGAAVKELDRTGIFVRGRRV